MATVWVVLRQGLTRSLTPSKPYSLMQSYIQQVVAVVTASISIFLGLFTFYWFLRMKKDFRHHLIMLLVAANMIKAIGYSVYPALKLVQGFSDYDSGNGPKPISRTLCLANGFGLSWGIEASAVTDFVILLIAVHTALTVFRPRTTPQETGLSPFRIMAYMILLAFPTLMASLAFVNTSFPYSSSGTFCYLPARPIWYRLALSWIPRYLILVTVLTVYAAVYTYAKFKFEEFKTKVSDDSGCLPSQLESAQDRDLTCYEELESAANTTTKLPGKATFSGQKSNARILQRHRFIKRQLRLMFIYPIVYFIMWIPPFANHCWLYTPDPQPPFALTIIAVICLAGQCAVDSIVFIGREQPWRFVKMQSSLSHRNTIPGRRRVQSEGMELAPVRARMGPKGKKGHDGTRQWWDHDAYILDGPAMEESSAKAFRTTPR